MEIVSKDYLEGAYKVKDVDVQTYGRVAIRKSDGLTEQIQSASQLHEYRSFQLTGDNIWGLVCSPSFKTNEYGFIGKITIISGSGSMAAKQTISADITATITYNTDKTINSAILTTTNPSIVPTVIDVSNNHHIQIIVRKIYYTCTCVMDGLIMGINSVQPAAMAQLKYFSNGLPYSDTNALTITKYVPELIEYQEKVEPNSLI